ncbi:hypothetical protein GCM10023196_102130 [Actinoallomurus vinaceus]|uniref:ABC transporter permease n=1 Tax=Actinoallomurus vinaceus TaxID=1080074 RepID=A0ABP8UTK6_9ACTN
MRLLRAELRKLDRPLLYGVTFASALFCVLLAVTGASNARQGAQEAVPIPSCATMGVQEGPPCTAAQKRMRVRITVLRMRHLAIATHTAAQLNPAAAGAETAGLMASLPGVLALSLLAGGHIGGEWSGRTLKSVLTACGHRWRVLAAKLVSLWLAGAALIGACWAALAVAGPVLVRAYRLPDPHETVAEAVRWSGAQAGRALLVLAVFSAVSLLAAVVTRSTIGTTATTAGTFIVMLALAALPGTGRWTPATWVQGWMGFAAGQGSITALPDNFWSRFITAGGAEPGRLFGLTGLAATFLACATVAVVLFRSADVT